MKNIINFLIGIAHEFVAGLLITAISFFGGIIINNFKPEVIMPYILFIIIFVSLVIIWKFYSFGTVKFKWGHIHSFSRRKMTLKSDCTATDEEYLGTIKKRNFSGKVSGNYDWSDVSVEKIEGKAVNSKISFTYKDANGKKISELNNNSIEISGKPINAVCDIEFPNNYPENIKMEISMKYNKNIMEPKYYVDVVRPIKKLTIELLVENSVGIRQIKKEIVAMYGDKNANNNKTVYTSDLSGKEYYNTPGMTLYKIVVRNPKILHRYQIVWEWV